MKYLFNYDLFLEAKLISNSSINGDSETLKKFKDYQNQKFIEDTNLKKYITLKQRIDNKKVRFEISYNHNKNHNLLDRIKNRTDLKSISEFNEKIEFVINELFPNLLNKDINVDGNYSIYLKNSNYTLSFNIKYNEIVREIYKIYLITTISGMSNKGYTIEIND